MHRRPAYDLGIGGKTGYPPRRRRPLVVLRRRNCASNGRSAGGQLKSWPRSHANHLFQFFSFQDTPVRPRAQRISVDNLRFAEHALIDRAHIILRSNCPVFSPLSRATTQTGPSFSASRSDRRSVAGHGRPRPAAQAVPGRPASERPPRSDRPFRPDGVCRRSSCLHRACRGHRRAFR